MTINCSRKCIFLNDVKLLYRKYSAPVVSCPILSPPNNGYFVKKNCSNAVNAACGVRCHMGYTLIGSSVRICQGNGTWTGTSPICQAKHCDSPKAVPNSEVICSNEESQFEMTFTYDGSGKVIKQSATEINKNENLVESDVARTGNRSFRYPVGTTCIYSCLRGHDLIGSRSRGCLPMLKWSGLKPKCKSEFKKTKKSTSTRAIKFN